MLFKGPQIIERIEVWRMAEAERGPWRGTKLGGAAGLEGKGVGI